jgi:DNA-binding LacI/PurR family transcriptional regulator
MLATEHLLSLGHRKIAFIAGDINHPSIYDRYQGYKNALEKAGIETDRNLVVTDEDYPARENGYNAAKRLLERNEDFTAVFTCNDAMAIGVMQYLKEAGRRIPEDISVIGFDDVEADLSLDPPLSTISVPKVEMGVEVMRLMADILGNVSDKPKKVLVPVELIERDSTAKI